MKKIVALILCAVFAFSALTCIVSAQASTSDDYSYVSSSVSTTEPTTELESIIDELFGDNLRDKTDEALNFFEVMRGFFEEVVNFFQSMLDYLMNLGKE